MRWISQTTYPARTETRSASNHRDTLLLVFRTRAVAFIRWSETAFALKFVTRAMSFCVSSRPYNVFRSHSVRSDCRAELGRLGKRIITAKSSCYRWHTVHFGSVLYPSFRYIKHLFSKKK